MKVAVYTCVTGGYDTVKPPRHVDPRLDYLCFTDRPDAVPSPWQPCAAALLHLDAKDSNRFFKMHPHLVPQLSVYDATVYVDGSIALIGDVHEFVEACMASPAEIFLYDHPFRDCAYDEAWACAQFGHDDVLTIANQMRRYRRAGFPAHAGLCECCVIVRRRSDAVARMMEQWWIEYRRGAKRDQLALSYVAWHNGIRLQSLGTSDPRYGHRYFELFPHRTTTAPLRVKLRTLFNRCLMKLLPHRVLFGHEANTTR